jgi:hypothetical protein
LLDGATLVRSDLDQYRIVFGDGLRSGVKLSALNTKSQRLESIL